MSIKKLPQYIINKLKAGEVVERPNSVVKELLENSIDAKASSIVLEIKEGGKKFIKVEDNGEGISSKELSQSILSYSTSKINSWEDVQNINSYGFRGEALATIAQVSKFTIQSKTQDEHTATSLTKIDKQEYQENIPFHKSSGTIVMVEDLFFNVPARQKFLKANTTEWNYILSTFLNFALVNYDIGFNLIKDDKVYMNLKASDDLYSRIFDIYKKDWKKNINYFEKDVDIAKIYGIASDSSLSFSSQNYIRVFVNQRPVEDKIIKKAIMECYQRQLPIGEYPFVVLFLEISPELVDVNVHPRKLEVKFQDPGSIFNLIKDTIQQNLGENKISSAGFDFSEGKAGANSGNFFHQKSSRNFSKGLDLGFTKDITSDEGFRNSKEDTSSQIENYKVIGQLWNSYIIVEGNEEIYFVDQHALAERITFEKMKANYHNEKLYPEIILNPITTEVSKDVDVTDKIEELNNLGFDIDFFGENKVILYAIPRIFTEYQIDIEKVIDKIINMENINMDTIFEEIFATRACKTSIKAGDKLSLPEMVNLIKDGFKYIDQMFVCQHGRPSFVKVTKDEINKLFAR